MAQITSGIHKRRANDSRNDGIRKEYTGRRNRRQCRFIHKHLTINHRLARTKDKTILEQLKDIHERITEVNTYSYANLSELQKQGKRLFHSLFVFENYPVPEGTAGEEGKAPIRLGLRYSVEKLDYLFGVLAYKHQWINNKAEICRRIYRRRKSKKRY